MIVGTETYPPSIDRDWARRASSTRTYRRLHLDRLGLPRRGRHRPDRVRRRSRRARQSAFHGEYPWLTAWCGDIDITGHRRPLSYYREIVFGPARRPVPRGAAARAPRRGRRRTRARGRGATSSRAGRGPATRAQPVTSRSTPTPTRSSCSSNGTSLGRQPAGDEHRFRAEFETDLRAGRARARSPGADGEEIGRTALRSATGPVLLDVRRRPLARSAPTHPTSRTSRSRWSTRRARCTPPRDRRGDRRASTAPACSRASAARNPCTEETFTDVACTTRSTAARSR